MNKNTTLLNIPLYNGMYSDFLATIQNPTKKILVFTPNPEIFVRANRDAEFMDVLKQATYNVPDGNGLYVGYMMQEGRGFFSAGFRTFFDKRGVRNDYGELVKGSDLVRDILEDSRFKIQDSRGELEKRRILVIDRKNAVPQNDFERMKAEIQKNLKNIIESKYPGVELFVVFSGEKTPEEIAKLIETESIEYVFSCVGMKVQEKLLIDIFSYLPESQKVVGLGVGASIDFLLGLQKRAPIVFQKFGLEWLYRLITQPRIRAKRIWDAVHHFPRLVKSSLKK